MGSAQDPIICRSLQYVMQPHNTTLVCAAWGHASLANSGVILPPARPSQLPLPHPGGGEQLAVLCRVWGSHHSPHAAASVLRCQVKQCYHCQREVPFSTLVQGS